MPSIEDYALIGDLQTAALVSREGSIDWCCFPRFDSGACFASMLGDADNGRWLLAPSIPVRRCTRRYRHDTLILESIYETDEGTVRAIDFMPPRGEAPDIVRIVEGLSGEVPMRAELVIRFDYGHIVPWVRRIEDSLVAIAGPDALCLWSPVETHGEGMTTVSEFTLTPGDRLGFVLTWFPSHEPVPRAPEPERALSDTEEYWLDWTGRLTSGGDYHEEINSSLIVLKAMDPAAVRAGLEGVTGVPGRMERIDAGQPFGGGRRLRPLAGVAGEGPGAARPGRRGAGWRPDRGLRVGGRAGRREARR